jgi:ribulose-phosphate 3-epimerase
LRSLSAIEASLPHCDLVLVMSVMPGFGGQEFEDEAIEKLHELSVRKDCDALLEVDGGVNAKTARACGEAGAELFVAGTAIFAEGDYRVAIERIHEAAVGKKQIQKAGRK